MSNGLDPKEKNAILIFISILLLVLAYVYTHELPWEANQRSISNEENGVYQDPMKSSNRRFY